MVSPIPSSGGNGNPTDKIEYFLSVEYGVNSYETLAKIIRMSPRQVVDLVYLGLPPPGNLNRFLITGLHPGEEFKLVVKDAVGNGMAYGKVSVDMYVNDSWCKALATIDGDDFTTQKGQKFWVPTSSAGC